MSLEKSQQNVLLDASQLSSITQLVQTCSPLQLAWASGFLAAKSSMEPLAANVLSGTASESTKAKTLTILFASQTGNAKGVAKKIK
jgi:sulfite reductase (NADPH) flavoprotein alpha-component